MMIAVWIVTVEALQLALNTIGGSWGSFRPRIPSDHIGFDGCPHFIPYFRFIISHYIQNYLYDRAQETEDRGQGTGHDRDRTG